jgi:hypothetical protein
MGRQLFKELRPLPLCNNVINPCVFPPVSCLRFMATMSMEKNYVPIVGHIAR